MVEIDGRPGEGSVLGNPRGELFVGLMELLGIWESFLRYIVGIPALADLGLLPLLSSRDGPPCLGPIGCLMCLVTDPISGASVG